MLPMKIFEKVAYDRDADACYIFLAWWEVATTQILKDWLIVDKNAEGKAVWIEILSAKKHMDFLEKLLLSSEQVEECILS